MHSAFWPLTLVPSATDLSTVQVGIVTLVISILACKLVRKLISNENSPPGPWGIPVIGHLPLLGKDPSVTFMKMRKKFGDIFQIKMGSWTAVIVNGKSAIREALHSSGDDFSGRPQIVSSGVVNKGESLSLGVYNEKWKIHHKIAAKVIGEFTNANKNPIEDMVHEEVDVLVNCFSSHAGKSFAPHDFISVSVSSIMYQICYGRKNNLRECKDFTTYLHHAGEYNTFVSAGNPIDVIPWLQYFMPWKLQRFAHFISIGIDFRNKRVEEHRKTFSPDHIRDITDGLLAASRKEKRLSEQRILQTIDAVFGAGSETFAGSLRWAVLLMAAHPDVQKRVQAEIDDIVGDGRRPRIQDRSQLVYTEAVLHEINRYVALEPLANPHSTIRNTKLKGYSIKKDSIVYINLLSMSHDKDVWGDPDVFRPERFLDDAGQIDKSLLNEFLPFSTGGRKCMGESLAKTEMFLFFSGLLQRCSILKPPDVTEYSMDARVGLTRECLPYNILVKLRN